MESRTFEFLSLLSYAHLKSGSAEAAADLLSALQVLEPDNAWVNRTLAYAQLLAGQHAACLEQIERCRNSADDKALQLIRSRALWASGQREEAKRVAAGMSGNLRGLAVPKGSAG